MRSYLHRHMAVAFALAVSGAAHAQTAAAAPATVTVPSEQIYLTNTTEQEIVLFVESENTQRTEYHLAPGAARTLSGEPGDKWLNIEMQPGTAAAGASPGGVPAGARP